MSEFLPTFLIAGAAKAGSSSLYHYLSLHPEICMSKGKEPGFFTKNWGKSIDFYSQSFQNCCGARAIGEATVEYMVDPAAAARIVKVLPDVRLVFLLRDPIERAVSHYWHRVKGRYEDRPLHVVLRGNTAEYPISYSMYATHLERFLEYFQPSRMHVMILEEFKMSFEMSLARLLEFLGVDPTFTIERPPVKNKARIQRVFAIEDGLRYMARCSNNMRWIPKSIRGLGGKVAEKIIRLNMRRFDPPQLEPEIRTHLLEIFQPEVVRLEKILGRRLEVWPSFLDHGKGGTV